MSSRARATSFSATQQGTLPARLSASTADGSRSSVTLFQRLDLGTIACHYRRRHGAWTGQFSFFWCMKQSYLCPSVRLSKPGRVHPHTRNAKKHLGRTRTVYRSTLISCGHPTDDHVQRKTGSIPIDARIRTIFVTSSWSNTQWP